MPRITPVSRSQRPSRPTHQQPPQLTMPLTSGRARPTSTSQRDHCTSCQLTASTTVAVPLASRPGCALGCRPLQGRQLASTGPCEAALSFALQATTRRGCSRSQARATALCLAATLLGCSPEHKPAAQHKPAVQHKPAQPSTSPPSLVQAHPASHKPIQPSTSPPSLASRLAGYAPPHRSAGPSTGGGGGAAAAAARGQSRWYGTDGSYSWRPCDVLRYDPASCLPSLPPPSLPASPNGALYCSAYRGSERLLAPRRAFGPLPRLTRRAPACAPPA